MVISRRGSYFLLIGSLEEEPEENVHSPQPRDQSVISFLLLFIQCGNSYLWAHLLVSVNVL